MRTRAYWNAFIDTALASLGLSSSAAADWKLLRDICVTIIMILDGFWQMFQVDIDMALATKQPGTLSWYASIAKAFQYGDTIIVTDGVLGYATDNSAARIVTQAAVREVDEEVIALKVAKTVGGSLTALSSPEFTAFKNYIAARRVPGVKVSPVSALPDVVTYALAVTFNPRFDEVALAAAVDSALIAFRDTFGFDALLYKAQLIDAIIDVPGVVNATGAITVAFSIGGTATLSDSLELLAGYFNYDPASAIAYTPAP